MSRAPLVLIALYALSACATAGAPPRPPSSYPCPVIGSSDWFAGIDAMPGPAGPRLVVTGKVQAPTGGYRFQLGNMRVLESYPVQIVLELQQLPVVGQPPSAVTLIAEVHEVRGEWPMQPPVGSVTIRCAERELARISPVGTAH